MWQEQYKLLLLEMCIFNAKSADERNSHGKYLNVFFLLKSPWYLGIPSRISHTKSSCKATKEGVKQLCLETEKL